MAKVQGLEIKRKKRRACGTCEGLHESGDHHKLDPSIDNDKWFATKVVKESSDLQENRNFTSPPFIPSTGWRAFPPNNIPTLFNYGHVNYYALESTPLNLDNTEDIEDELGHIPDKPMKNGRKYVVPCFVLDMMDITSYELTCGRR